MNRREFSAGSLALLARSKNLSAAPGAAAKIDETLRTGIARRKIPAVVGMVATGSQVVYQGAFGIRDSSGASVTIDSIFGIASMTKAITTVAALQLVEQGKLQLGEPVAKHLPQFASLEVLDHFDPSTGKAILRPARTPVTLKHLLTHTSGLCYDNWDSDMFRYVSQTSGPPAAGKVGTLMFEPGARWQYGQGIDWTGRLVEAISGMSLEEYFQSKILGPLEMRDTSFIQPPAKFDRLVTTWRRQDDGALKQDERKQPAAPRAFNGGGGLYSTVGDYTRFMQMILNKGRGINKARILQGKTVESMEVNQIGALSAGKMKSFRPNITSDVDIQPGFTEKWGLGFLINTTPYTQGRSAGSLAWAGIANTYYWIDPKRSLCATLMMQFYPFVDREAVGLLADFERAVYSA